jgi:apolipoprotein N-acyltransferase
MPQGVRNEAFSGEGENAADQMFNHFNLLGAVAAQRPPKPDLIAWPETSLPEEFSFSQPDVPKTAVNESWQRRLEEMPKITENAVKYWPGTLLLGVNTAELQTGGHVRRYNSGLLIREDGTVGGRYDKMHRVPFGEYVPFRDLLPFMNWLAPYDFEYSVSAGEHFSRFPLGQYHFGVVICYEDTDPTLARQYVTETTEGPKVDFILNISNDGWFDGTAEHEEHLAISRFRAIESRRAVLRSVNMGVSAVVDGNGRVLTPELQAKTEKVRCWEATPDSPDLPIGRWAEFKKVAGVLSAIVPIDHRDSVYAVVGDWLPWACWMFLAVGLCWGYAGGKRS